MGKAYGFWQLPFFLSMSPFINVLVFPVLELMLQKVIFFFTIFVSNFKKSLTKQTLFYDWKIFTNKKKYNNKR